MLILLLKCCSPSSQIVFKIFKLSLHVPMTIETVLFLNPAPSAFTILFRCGAFHQHLSSNKQRCFCWCPRDSKLVFPYSGQQKLTAWKTHQPFSSFVSNPFTWNHEILSRRPPKSASVRLRGAREVFFGFVTTSFAITTSSPSSSARSSSWRVVWWYGKVRRSKCTLQHQP